MVTMEIIIINNNGYYENNNYYGNMKLLLLLLLLLLFTLVLTTRIIPLKTENQKYIKTKQPSCAFSLFKKYIRKALKPTKKGNTKS